MHQPEKIPYEKTFLESMFGALFLVEKWFKGSKNTTS